MKNAEVIERDECDVITPLITDPFPLSVKKVNEHNSILTLEVFVIDRKEVVRVVMEEEEVDGNTVTESSLSVPAEIVRKEEVRVGEEMEKEMEENVRKTLDEEMMNREEDSTEVKYFRT